MDKENRSKTFNEILCESTENLLNTLGEESKNLIYLYLKGRLNIDREEIPQRIDDFFGALEVLLGAGAKPLEMQLLKMVEDRTGITRPLTIQESPMDYLLFLREEYEKARR